jgi:putative ABC transport system substrate-binding protein
MHESDRELATPAWGRGKPGPWRHAADPRGRWSRRRLIGWLAGTGVVAVTGCALPNPAGTPPKRPPRIGYLSANPADYPAPLGPPHVEEFRAGLREQGYVEGQNVEVVYRFANLQFDQLPALAAELVGQPVDVLVVGDTRSIQPVKQATSSIPVVLILTSDPVLTGNVASLARPGGNTTGLTMAPIETMGKRLELLRNAVPDLSRAALLYNGQDTLAQRATAEVARAATLLGLDYEGLEVREPEDVALALQRASRNHVGGLVVYGDPFLNSQIARLAQLALELGLPAIGMSRETTEAGLLLSYAPNLPALYRRAAAYVDKILRGTNPGEIPVERPMRFDLVLNLRTANALGLQLDNRLLMEATDVVS